MNSSWVGSGIARARSVTNITAPFSTVTSSRSSSSGTDDVAILARRSSRRAPTVRAWIWLLGQQHRLDVARIQLGGGLLRHAISVPCRCACADQRGRHRRRSDRLAVQAQQRSRRGGPRPTAAGAAAHPTATPPCPRQSVTSSSTRRICSSVRSVAPPASSQPRMTLRRNASGSAASRRGVQPVGAGDRRHRPAGPVRRARRMSSRSAAAVRARASATPPPSTSSSNGSTSVRSRARV